MTKQFYNKECVKNAKNLYRSYMNNRDKVYVDEEPVRAKRRIIKDFTAMFNESDRGRYKLTISGLAVVVDYEPHAASEYAMETEYTFTFSVYAGQTYVDKVKSMVHHWDSLVLQCEHMDIEIKFDEEVFDDD